MVVLVAELICAFWKHYKSSANTKVIGSKHGWEVQSGVDAETFKKIIDRYEQNLEAANLAVGELRKAQADKTKIVEQLPSLLNEVQELARKGDESATRAIELLRTAGFLQPLSLALTLNGRTNSVPEPIANVARVEQEARQRRLADYCRWIDVPSTGSSDAKVTIAVFEDYQDPLTARFKKTIELIRNAYSSNDVRICFLNNPLPFHPNAFKRATASLVASHFGAFGSFRSMLFTERSLSEEDFVKFASGLGIEPSTYRILLGDKNIEKRVHDEMALALSIGAGATPSTSINGELILGAVSFERISSVIDRALQAHQAIETNRP